MTDVDINVAERLRRLEQAQADEDRAKDLVNQPPQPPPLSAFSQAITQRQNELRAARLEAAQKAARKAEAAREAEEAREALYLESVQPQLDALDRRIAAIDTELTKLADERADLGGGSSLRHRRRRPRRRLRSRRRPSRAGWGGCSGATRSAREPTLSMAPICRRPPPSWPICGSATRCRRALLMGGSTAGGS
jgi:hypothetical protein